MTAIMQHLEVQLTSPKRVHRFQPSERLSDRKRALFPSHDSDSDTDLGHMSPLELSSSPEKYDDIIFPNDKTRDIKFKYFNIFERGKYLDSPSKNTEQNENMNSNTIIFTPNTPTSTNSPQKNRDTTIIPDTPVKASPTQILKTPHDNTNNTNLQLPRLVRKSLLDISNIDKSNLKRKSDSPENTTGNKSFKVDHSTNKIPKARTALFTESVISTKSFYPKTEATKHEHNVRVDDATEKVKKILRKPPSIYLCNRSRGRSKKNYIGQINAGVRHGIKKPKRTPALSKTQLLKAALNIIKNSPLNNYLDKLDKEEQVGQTQNECGVSLEQIQKMDSILKGIDIRTNLAQPLKIFSAATKTKPETETIRKHITENSTFSLKRPLSPQQQSNKKFFKSEPSRATITINDNIKLNLDHGELSIIEKHVRICRPKTEYFEVDPLEFSFEVSKTEHSFTDILKSLEDDNILESIPQQAIPINTTPELSLNNQVVLTAHNSIAQSENSIQLHEAPANITQQQIHKNKHLTNDMLLSPTSLVCDLTSGLALDSPKSQINQTLDLNMLSATKKQISFPETMTEDTKLFPIFNGKQNDAVTKSTVRESRHVKNIRKIWKPLSTDQTLIDAGQKKFGLTQCPDCKVMYSQGEPDDEIKHYNYHNNINVLKYHNWKHERIVSHMRNGKIIQVNSNDPKTWWRKVRELLEVVNRELGFYETIFNPEDKKVFLCIMNRQIVGCLVSEVKSEAHKMLPSGGNEPDQCSEESYPIKCGVSRLWVAVTHRKQGIATCLMNAMRLNYMYGHILSMNDIAFSSPTEAGKCFAQKYTKTDRFLIYIS